MSTMPMRPAETEARGAAMIGKSVLVNGQVMSREDLYVDGEVDGSIEMQEHKLTVGPNGKVQAGIKAREVVVIGSVNGNVDASDKIEIRRDARLVGDIRTARIVIEEGAYFKGSVDITRTEPAKQQAKPAAAPAPAPATAAPAAAGVDAKR
ncbi:MAG: polymer-forming cytoskeletal protein [Bryobacteraceae bacterium]|nr:polymer-forming cytoskeletal protein [Bryobacteraceae bacterium]